MTINRQTYGNIPAATLQEMAQDVLPTPIDKPLGLIKTEMDAADLYIEEYLPTKLKPNGRIIFV